MAGNARKTQLSVTNFIHCGDDYLFVKKNNKRWVDPGLMNGIGGKLEPGEDYLTTAIRETKEETGYEVAEKDISMSGIVRLEGGYEDDWVMVFFKIAVESKNIPLGNKNDEGDLLWIHKDELLNNGYDLVDDLNYVFEDIANDRTPFFMSCKVNENEKIESYTLTRL